MSTAKNPEPGMAFDSAEDVCRSLLGAGYVASPAIGYVVHLATRLAKPILAEGPAGTGKTALAKALALVTGARLIRLQCYEGLDESKALYEWDYRRQLLRIQGAGSASTSSAWDAIETDIFSESFLLERPLLEAIRADEPVILLIDEVDRLDVEAEALLLEILSEFQVSIPELGTIAARRRPTVILTSNNSRELSEALKRRCLFLHVGYPSREIEAGIVRSAVPGLDEQLAEQLTDVVGTLRDLDVKKRPSVSETIDAARALEVLAVESLTADTVVQMLPLLLKHQRDVEKAEAEITERPA